MYAEKKSQILRYVWKVQNCHACQKFLIYSRFVRKRVFLFLKIRRKPTSPVMRNNEFKGTSIRKNCIPYQSPKSTKKWCYSWLQPIKTIYEVEAYDVFQVMSWFITICRHPSDCHSLREEQLQNLDMFYAGQGLYP